MKDLATGDSAPEISFEEHLRQRIAAEGPLPWSEVMAAALYEPGLGYYAREVRRVGRKGDFYTSVSVGPLYGQLLAELANGVWEAAGCPQQFIIAEQAAHDGQLAADVWEALQSGPLGKVVSWRIVEPQTVYRAAQQERLNPLMGDRIEWLHDVSELAGCGVFLCNELLDAFPVNRVRWTPMGWEDLLVDVVGDEFRWASRWSEDPELDRLPEDVEPGYTTETHGAMVRWAEALAASTWEGAVMIADYGYDGEDYYRPERSDGTLRRYNKHGTDGDVLKELGNCDLTAHINFTRLRLVLERARFEVKADLPQGRFLTLVGIPWLKALEGSTPFGEHRSIMRQFHTLTHPGHMGSAFRVMLLGRGLTASYKLPTLH